MIRQEQDHLIEIGGLPAGQGPKDTLESGDDLFRARQIFSAVSIVAGRQRYGSCMQGPQPMQFRENYSVAWSKPSKLPNSPFARNHDFAGFPYAALSGEE